MPLRPIRVISQGQLARGSEWRKWDLHVHSPASGLNNQFTRLPSGEADWEAYIRKLESLSDIAVLGITDYFSIEGYRKVLQYRSQGRLQNIALILPNIELRLNTFSGSSGTPRRINYHVIFSDEVSEDDVEDHFLGQLRFSYESAPNDGTSEWPINRVNLERLGDKLKREQPTFRGSTYEIGCTNATVDAATVKSLLKNKGAIFGGKHLIVVENTSDLLWEGQDHQTRKILLQGAHAIFTSNESTIRWARGEHDLSADQFVSEFKSLKPCFHGCDAHSLDTIGRPDGGRFCWIRADTTFEGLKQVLYEPKDRLYIGEFPPGAKNDYQIIDSIEINSPAWFIPMRIPINRDLVAIIGGRGSGKSALAEIIAFAAGSRIFESDEDMTDAFLAKASRRSSTNPSPITGAKVTLRWRDGTSEPVVIGSSLRHNLRVEKVKYLPQKFVETMCAPENNQQLEEEIERVIFHRLDKTDRLDASDFRELRERATAAINLKKAQIRRDIRTLNQNIFEVSLRIRQRPSKVGELASQVAELERLKKEAPEVPQADEEEIQRRDLLSNEKQELENIIVQCEEQLNTLNTIESKVDIIRGEVSAYNSEIEELLTSVGLSAEKTNFTLTLPSRTALVLDRRRKEINDTITSVREGVPESPSTPSLKTIAAELVDLDQKSQLTDIRRKQHEKFQKDRQQIEGTIASLEREIKEIEDTAIPRLNKDKQTLLTRYSNFFELLKEEQSLLERLYGPLRRALQSSNTTARKLAFVSHITLAIAEHAKNGYELIDRRKVFREDNSLEAALREFFIRMEEADYSRRGIDFALQNLRAPATTGDELLDVAENLRKEKTQKNFDDWFYDTEPFAVSYSIKYDDKDLQLLSPGEKGVVLLLLYLEAEREDNRPLVIDQPDDNLDNLSVYPSLVEYFRNRKKSRQIIIITHNPNLVVNTDAEQIIVANFDGSRVPRISYTSGLLRTPKSPGRLPGFARTSARFLKVELRHSRSVSKSMLCPKYRLIESTGMLGREPATSLTD
jgi:ABC-type lipoprotein export system ATPase subunit